MTFKAAKCPNCAGELQLPDDRDSVKCMYCGSDIIVREAIKAAAGAVNIENLMMLAKNAEKAGKNDEAYKYYSSVLEYDPKNVNAWMGRGLTSSKVDIHCLLNAIEYSVDQEDTKREILNLLKIDSVSSADDIWNYPSFSIKWAYFSLIHSIDENNLLGLLGAALGAHDDFVTQIDLFRKALDISKNDKKVFKLIMDSICMTYGRETNNVKLHLSKIQPIIHFAHEIDPSDRKIEKWLISHMCSVYSESEASVDNKETFRNLLREVERVDSSFNHGKIPKCFKSGWFSW